MAIEDIPPFAKVGGIVVGLTILGAIMWCGSRRSTYDHAACDPLPVHLINPCLEKVQKSCKGDEDTARACAEKIAGEVKAQQK